MKCYLALGLMCLLSCSLHAQAVDATVCDILKNPTSFNGKIVRVKGTVSAGFDQFVVKGVGCNLPVSDLWLSYPEGTRAKSGPAAMLQLQPARNFSGTFTPVERAPVHLEKNKDFKQFDNLLSTPYRSGGMCLGCVRYEVDATLVGRLDGTTPAMRRNDAGKIVAIDGFGNLNRYAVRLVLQSVSDVVSHEVDYSKIAPITKSDTFQEVDSDAVETAHQAAHAFGAGTFAGDQIGRAADAFGKPDDDNGVIVSSRDLNEVTARSEQKSSHDSPDGVIYTVTIDELRMKGDAMARAIVHMGVHVADLRSPPPDKANLGLYDLEYRAWTITVLDVLAAGQKTLTVSGGYLLWNLGWTPTDRNKAMDDGLKAFLTKQELLSR
jgi:hypothetical protein